MSGIRRKWLGRALAAGLVTATTMATPIAASAALVGIAEPDAFTVAEDSDLGNIENFFDVLLNDNTDLDGNKPVITEYTQGAKGTVGQVLSGGKIVKLTYIPDADAFGTDGFTYTVTQGGEIEVETVDVTITGSQDAPVAATDELPLSPGGIVENDAPIDILADVLSNDFDVDEDSFTITSVDLEGVAGDVVFTAATEFDPAVLTYEATSDSATSDSFTYVITDSESNVSAAATVNITITPVDDAPVANDDGVAPILELDEGGSLLIDVLANDVDLDEEPVVIDELLISEPASGTAALDGNKILYTHDGGDTLADSFTYGVVGGNTATVTVAINAVDDLPGAEDDGTAEAPFATVDEAGPIVLDVLANDTDSDGGPLEVASIGAVPASHTATVITDGGADDGKILFTHVGDDLADITFTYELNGGSTASVFLAVANTDDDAFAVDNVEVDLDEDADATTIVVLADGQTDGDGDTLVLTAIGDSLDTVNLDGVNPTKGSAALVDVGGVMTLDYTPSADENGLDTFTVEVSDGTTGDEVTVTIIVNIAPVNDAPVAAGDMYTHKSQIEADEAGEFEILVLEDSPIALPVLANDVDIDGDFLSVDPTSITLDPAIGTLTVGRGDLLFAPAENYFGSFSFTYKAIETSTDPALSSDAVTVNVTVVAQPDPVTAVNDVADVREDAVVYVSVLGNDTDVDGFGLRIVSVGQPADGFTAIAGNRIRVEPDPDFNGELVFTYVIEPTSDITYDVDAGVTEVTCPDPSACERMTATVTVQVTPFNDRPDANTDSGITTDEDVPVSIDVLANDTDIDGDELSIWTVGAATLGTTAIVDGEVLYTPNANEFGSDSFVYYAYDGKALSVASVNLTIAPVADAPTIEDVSTSGLEDNAVEVELTVDDVDPDNVGLAVSVTGVTVPGGDAEGTVSLDGTTLTFTPPANWVGTAEISVLVIDDDDLEGEGLVSIEIGAVNDVPVIDDASGETDEDESVSIPMTFSDIEDDVTIEISGDPSNGSAVVDGASVIYTPAADFNGDDSFTVKTTDSEGAFAEATVDVSVNPVNDAPTIEAPESLSGPEDFDVEFSVTVADIDSEVLTVSVGTPPSVGSVEIDGTDVTYTPPANWFGVVDFTLVVTDDDALASELAASVSIEITSVNDLPYIFNASAVVPEDGSFTLYLGFGDVEDEQSLLTISVDTEPSFGTVVPHPTDGTKVIYTPFENVNGSDTFKLKVTDTDGGSAIGIVDFEITSINDVPVIDDASGETDEDESVTIPMTFSDIEDDLTIVILEGPANGTVVVDGASVVYTPADDFNGDDSFTVKTTDSDEASAEATVDVIVNPVNDAPTIDDASALVDEDASVIIPITAGDIDSDYTVAVSSAPSKGTAIIDGSDVTYTPNPNANGADSFEVTATDGDGASAVATVAVNIKAINDNPTAKPCAGVTVESGKSIVFSVASCGTDIDGDVLSVKAGSATASKGIAAKSGAQAVKYSAAAGYVGADTVNFTLADGKGGFVAVSVAVTVKAPVNPYVGSAGVDGQVVRIYSAMLGRLPDAGGFEYWTALRNEGLSLDRMIRIFAGSPEFQATFGNRIIEDTDSEWVDFVYGEIMNRTPDAGGRAFWLDMLGSGRISRSSMVVVFAESAEYQRLTETS